MASEGSWFPWQCVPHCNCKPPVAGSGGEDEADANATGVIQCAEDSFDSGATVTAVHGDPIRLRKEKEVLASGGSKSSGREDATTADPENLSTLSSFREFPSDSATSSFEAPAKSGDSEFPLMRPPEDPAIRSSALRFGRQTSANSDVSDQPSSITPYSCQRRPSITGELTGLLKSDGPSELAIARGMHIEPIYDLYDTLSRRSRVKRIQQSEIHKRRSRRKSAVNILDDLHTQFSRFESCGSATSDTSGPSAASAGTGSTSDSDIEKQTQQMERITMWAVLVGVLLHRQVLDFSALASMAIVNTREIQALAIAQEANAGVVRRTLHQKAGLVVSQAMKLGKRFKAEKVDVLDEEWKDEKLLSYLFSTEYIDVLHTFANATAKLLAKQPTVAAASAPCRVFGDIHGQLRDLLLFCCFWSPRP